MIAYLTRKSVGALHKMGHQFVHRGWKSRSLRIGQTEGVAYIYIYIYIYICVTVADTLPASAGPLPVGCRVSLQLMGPIESMRR